MIERDFAEASRQKKLQRTQPLWLTMSSYTKWGLGAATLLCGAAGYLITGDGFGAIGGAAAPGTAYFIKRAFF